MSAAPLHYLTDRWDDVVASSLDPVDLLRYRSNLLGSDLRITNFGGGNTSSKLNEIDILNGTTASVLWVKGSGGDLGSIKRSGFAGLYQDKVLALENIYKGVEFEDEIAAMYPLCAFGGNPVAASIDTPLHGFLPFAHVDHLHPDWGIALAASANGLEKMAEFNERFGHAMVWLPWQRPGFELALMMRRAVAALPGCDGVVLGGHGLFTWGDTQRQSYLNTITMVDHLGQFVEEHDRNRSMSFGGAARDAREDRQQIARALMPFLRGRMSVTRRAIGSFVDSPDVLAFVNSRSVRELAYLGTSCPDHFIRTKIRPMFVACDSDTDLKQLEAAADTSLAEYRTEYAAYYERYALPDSPAMRDANPAVVLVPGVGMFSFGKNKTDSRLVSEFYTNAIHVMDGAGKMDGGRRPEVLPQSGDAAPTSAFSVHRNYVALPPAEAFRIEYWALEDAKIRRQPPDKELSRRIVLIVGGASSLGRAVALLAAERGAHVVVADLSLEAAQKVANEAKTSAGQESAIAVRIDLQSRDAICEALDATIDAFGGLDILVDATKMSLSRDDANGVTQSAKALEAEALFDLMLFDEAAALFNRQRLPGSVVLINATDALVCDLSDSHSSLLRVNCIRSIHLMDGASTLEQDCAEAILYIGGPSASSITGQTISVGGGLTGAQLSSSS